MMRDIEIGGKIVQFEFVVPEEVREFLQRNALDENQFLKDYKWEQCILEDVEGVKVIDFGKAKLVINYLHISQDNQVRVSPEQFAKGKKRGGGNWDKGTFSDIMSVGYAIFVE
jgi:hypothetical protein